MILVPLSDHPYYLWQALVAAVWHREHGWPASFLVYCQGTPSDRLRTHTKGWLFPTKDGANHLSAKYVGALVTKALPDRWTTHTLRHHFATSAYAGTGDLLAVQQLLGHSNVSTTQRYVAIPRDGLRRAVAAVEIPIAA